MQINMAPQGRSFWSKDQKKEEKDPTKKKKDPTRRRREMQV
jgi:hypothetical protein